MPTFDPVAFGARLRKEMKTHDLDVKKLQKKVEYEVTIKTGTKRGTSYGTIWSYVNGHAPLEPRREVVEALAAVLSPPHDPLLSPFLLFGDGSRTRAEAAAEAVADGREASDDDAAYSADLEKAFLEGLPALSTAGAASWHAIGDLYSQFYVAYAPDIASGGGEKLVSVKWEDRRVHVEAARRVAELVAAAATLADVDLSRLSRRDLDRYIQNTTLALSVLFELANQFERHKRRWDAKLSKEGTTTEAEDDNV